ncbi:MAG: helicase-related protein [Chloroflexia bacterium]
MQDQSLRAASDPSQRGRALGFTMAMYQRRFASSVHAVRRSLERRLKRLEEQLRRPQAETAVDLSRLEDIEELPDDEAARLEEEVEQASLPSEREVIRREIEALRPLLEQARLLEERGRSSKLEKLRQLLTDQNLFGDPHIKLLLFTEHKETLDYLVEQLRKWGLRVTQIHGGMKIGDRDAPGTRLYAEREFRDEAQVLVATEAAGEGINLQFCWLMVNYDLPWNPMRLEQRIGRIHRYGQEHDCLIFNFVAANTREGQVLERLLERLAEIRRELGSDQVFNVVGEVIPANYLERLFRDLYAGRITQQALLERLARDVEQERFAQICRSALEGLARKELNLAVILGRTAEAQERRLVPEVVEDFFLQAVPAAGLSLRGRNGLYTVGRLPRRLQETGERLEERFGPLGREYRAITFDKGRLTDDPTLEWVTPGHPLFEAVREEVWEQAQDDLRRGAVFYDLCREEPARLEVFAASIADGRGNTLHRRLFVVEVDASGEMRLRQPAVFLDLLPAEGAARPDPPIALSREEVEAFLLKQALEPFLEEVRRERQRELDIIARHVELSLLTLIDRQQRQVAELLEWQERGEEVSLALGEAEKRLEELNERLDRRRAELARERQLSIADLTPIASALVLPHPEREGLAPLVRDEEVERIAMEEVMRYEREQGRLPEDVSAGDRGFDLLSRHPEGGQVRFIEVKGRAAVGPVVLTRNKTAERLRSDYWLYVVFDCATAPRLIPIQDPVRLGWEPVVRVEFYQAGPQALLAAGQREA